MGTLFEQPVRESFYINDEKIDKYIEQIKEVSKKHSLNIDQTLKVFEILELERRNNLRVANGNIHDEQMTGIGELLSNLNHNISNLVDALEKEN